MHKPTAIVLAAGLSRRMGAENKLLLPVDGQPMIRRTVRAYTECCDRVIVVTGFEAPAIRRALQDLTVHIVHNPDFANGQATSVATGLRAALGAADVLVGLGDQPLLTRHHLDALIKAHAGATKISVPHNGQSRGNPIAIPGPLAKRMLEDRQNPGCGKFTRERRDLVNFIPLKDPAYFTDVDTPEDYATVAPKEDAQ
ncbi:MAG: nucleotidyltransferase family protein [Pseudomonadota bacterium]